MKAAKIISFIASVFNGSLLVYYLYLFLRMRPTYQEVGIPVPFPWPLFVPTFFAIGGLLYYFYLRNKERKGETAKLALLFSIALLLIPFLITGGLMAVSLIQPMYEMLGK